MGKEGQCFLRIDDGRLMIAGCGRDGPYVSDKLDGSDPASPKGYSRKGRLTAAVASPSNRFPRHCLGQALRRAQGERGDAEIFAQDRCAGMTVMECVVKYLAGSL